MTPHKKVNDNGSEKVSVLQHYVNEEMCKSCWIMSYFGLESLTIQSAESD